MEACLAGACPSPAPRTLPRMTSSTSLGLKLIESMAPLMAKPPNSGAVNEERRPLNAPIAVLLAATM